MRSVFVDSVYWIAMVRPDDQWGEPSRRAKAALGEVLLVTTDEVLTEFLTMLGQSGPGLRRAAAKMVRAILDNPNVRVIPQTREGFLAGLKRYENREDKKYSLTDCISMNVMNSESLTEIPTNDHHFDQEGLAVLIKKDG